MTRRGRQVPAVDAPELGPRWVPSVEDLAARVSSGDRICVSGFHFVRAPMAQLVALRERDVHDLTWVAWGGGLPLEYLLGKEGLIRRLELCFSSFDIFGLAPRFRRAVEEGSVELFEMTALGYIAGLRASLAQLPYQPMQTPVETDLREVFSLDLPDPFGNSAPVSVVQPLDIDVLLLHAARADAAGNVEITGAVGHDELQAVAARTVLVTVEEVVPGSELGSLGGRILSRKFMDGIALSPGGAYPASCLPHYPADYERLAKLADVPATEALEAAHVSPTASELVEQRRRASTSPSRISAGLAEAAAIDPGERKSEWTIDELMAVVIARTIDDDSICSIGSVSPLATAAYYLAKRLWAPEAAILSYNGGYLDVQTHPLGLAASELLDYHSCVRFMSSDETYSWLYQQGRITHEWVSSAQVDKSAATNSVRITRSSGAMLRLPGQGGMADVADMHRTFSIYLARHSPRTLVKKVDFVGARRHHHGAARRQLGYQDGPVEVLTNLCRFELDTSQGELVVTHLHPGVTADEVRAETGWDVTFDPGLEQTPAPTSEELEILRSEIDPLGLRRLEFSAATDRAGITQDILEREARAFADEVEAQ